MISGSGYRQSGYYIPSSRGGSWTQGEKIAAIGLLIVVIILVIYFWPSSSPTPTSSSSPTPPSTPWKPYCTFKATGNNKDNFSIDSDSENYNLFPIDLPQTEYNQPLNYDDGESPITCHYNASTRSPKYASSGPTTNGYAFPTTPQIPQVFTPDDGTQTKIDDTCTWSPKENLCNTPICSLGKSYINVVLSNQDKEQGIKQYLSQGELDAFISRLSCPGGYKYGQCSSKTPGAPTQCSISEKQNNKINCLGNCSGDTNKFTKEDCEKDSKNEWVYDPSNTQCKYKPLDKPPIKIDGIHQETGGEYQGKYKMCDNPGDYVDVDSIVNTCSNTCYPNPNPNNDYTPFNTNEMPLSWTNQCGFTEVTNKTFTTSTSHISPCANSAVFKGNVYYNICSSDQNCSDVKSDIEDHVSSVSSVSPPCQGGGDIFDVYNNCSSASCDNIFSRSATGGSTFAQCPSNQTQKPPSPGTESAISLPPASDCNPDSTNPFSLNKYISKAVDNCCVNKTCDDEYLSCPTGYSKVSPSPSPGSSGPPLFQDCCVLKTCSKYVSDTNICMEGTTPTAGSSNTYVLPTCCNGYIQINIKLKTGINNFMTISKGSDTTLPNAFPSYILKQLLQPSTTITLNSINPTSINKSTDNFYFINNQTTFMNLPTNKQTMDSELTQTQDYQRKNIPKSGNQNGYNFYILTSQKYDSKSNSVISFNISEAYTTVKNITDKISNSESDPNISKINASLTDCRDTEGFKGICDIIPNQPTADQVLNGENSYCCFKSTCGNVLTQGQKDKLSGTPSSVSMPGWKACGSGTYFDGDSPWTPSSPITPISYINASNQCCVSGNITAYKPDTSDTSDETITDLYKTYVTKKNQGDNDISLPVSIDFQWVNGKFKPKDPNMNKNLATNYTCAFNNASTPEYGVSKHSNGTYYYKLTGCEDGDNTFCKIPNSHKQGDSDSDTYDASIYDLTGLMESNEGSYISMYATAQGGSESKHEGVIMANYGGIVCTSDPYGTVNLEPCDEPYDYIKFSGCNTYFPEDSDEYQFYTRTASPEDCLGLTEDSCNTNDYENLCIWEENKCSPRPFPTYGQQVGENCGVKLNADDNFSDAFWLTEGFQNYKDKSLFKKGDSTRVITPSPSPGSSGPPASSREVSRRTNYCGYKPTSQKGDTDQFHSRVVDSTWMCKDKTCKGDNLNIKLPKDDPSKLKSFTSYINGDPLIYNWSVGTTVSNANKEFYDGDYILTNGSFTLDDYRPLQGPPLTTFNLTDQYACVKTPSSSPSSSPCARPTASPGAKPVCDPSCTLTPISGINDINSGDNVKDRITKFIEIQNIGGTDYDPSQMEYVHNNIKYHNNYATMCGDNKYLRFFNFNDVENYQKCTPCRYQRDRLSTSSGLPNPPNTYNELYNTALKELNQQEQSYIYPKYSDASKPVFLSEEISRISTSNCPGGQNKASNRINSYTNCEQTIGEDKCNNSFYQWKTSDPGGDGKYYACVYNDNKTCTSPKTGSPLCINNPEKDNYCCYTSTSTSPPSSTPPSSPSDIIINETSPDKDDKNKMSNCSINSSPSKRTNIPIGEYSTHFVPWWSESSATDLKITDTNFITLSNQLSPGSPPINIPTCDLHKDRCEDKNTSAECNVNSSHSWTSPSPQHFNMCNWSGGKCETNPDWMNDQTMCGHPCLSRIDAKPRECKFSDDCEIRDRYNFKAFSGIANSPVTMYCDSYGRNPILYGIASESEYESNVMQNDTAGYCNPGYYLIDVGGVDNKDGSNKSVYKCLSCDELEFYKTDASSSGSITKNDMVNTFETYINACGTLVQQNLLRKAGSWKTDPTTGKCVKGIGNCTAFVWPAGAPKADPNLLVTQPADTTEKQYTSQDILYTQDTIVADQYIKSKIPTTEYSNCQSAVSESGGGKSTEDDIQIMNSEECKTYVSAMKKVLGLSTRQYNDRGDTFAGYDENLSISDMKIDFGNCDYSTEQIMAKWDKDPNSPTIPVNPGGMVATKDYKKPTTDNDWLILAGQLCPQRGYLTGGRPSEKSGKQISINDRHWPATTQKPDQGGGIKEYTYCKPLLEVGDKCPGRLEGKAACKSDNPQGKAGICGLKDPSKKWGSAETMHYNDTSNYYCLDGLPAGSPCNHDINSQCMEYAMREDGSIVWYGARCSLGAFGTSATCDGDVPDDERLTPSDACRADPKMCPKKWTIPNLKQ